ncbi:MAG: 2Fe-2S iron-sulfur cluster-binding protein [Sulfuricurvum sp.]
MAVLFLKNDNLKLKVPKGTTMRSAALKSGASMQFGCRVGDCGTCCARIVEGMEYLSPVNPKESALLAMTGFDGNEVRFMCQCLVESDEGEIVIEYM